MTRTVHIVGIVPPRFRSKCGLYEDQRSGHHVHEGNLAPAEWDRVTCLRCLRELRLRLARRMAMDARRLSDVSERHEAAMRKRRRAKR